MTIYDNIYRHCPALIQNTLISVYGLSVRRQRYGSFFQSPTIVSSSRDYSDSAIIAFHTQRLRDLLGHCKHHVPYYRDLFSSINLDINSITPENYPDLVPVLEKTTLKNEMRSFHSELYAPKELVTINTSGTTGSPIKIVATKNAIQQNYAFFDQFLSNIGVSELDKSATFAGRTVVPENQSKPPFWRYSWFQKTLYFSSYHISEESIPAYLKQLEQWSPTYIDSYPSAIFQLAKYILEHRIHHNINLKVIVTSSETLTDIQRDTIEAAFKCRVFDFYGCAELAVSAHQHHDGKYFIDPYYCIAEILDDQGRPVEPGEVGSLVCTGLLNDAMPLIRYRIGDQVRATEQAPIGPHWSYISTIEGRTDDMITTPEGNSVGRMDPVFKGQDHIVESQIVQNSLDSIQIKLVVGDAYSTDDESRLKEEVIKRLGPNMMIHFDYMDQIPKSDNGKFKSVVSNLEATR